jgi:hypothetical protein
VQPPALDHVVTADPDSWRIKAAPVRGAPVTGLCAGAPARHRRAYREIGPDQVGKFHWQRQQAEPSSCPARGRVRWAG